MIYVFCKYYKSEDVCLEHLEELQLVIQKIDFKVELLSKDFLHNRICLILLEIKKTIKTSQSYISGGTVGNRTYHPHYGTEYVFGYFRRRNGNIEWVQAHTRTRYR